MKRYAAKARASTLRALGVPVVQYGLGVVDAFYDLATWIRFSTPRAARTSDCSKLAALLQIDTHKLEKALSLRKIPTAFGPSHVSRLLGLLERWLHADNDADAVVVRSAAGALRAYQDLWGHRMEPESRARLHSILTAVSHRGDSFGDPTIEVSPCGVEQPDGFADLVMTRHSARHFSDEPVSSHIIEEAVGLAQRTPSACNRQPWRVHVYSTPSDKASVLSVQNGNAHFGDRVSHVLLLTVDRRVYVTSGERHQPYVDGGMFAMTLVYALQARGVVTCCLNLCRYSLQMPRLLRACRIPSWEAPIMMIAVGNPRQRYLVAASARRSTEEVLSWREL